MMGCGGTKVTPEVKKNPPLPAPRRHDPRCPLNPRKLFLLEKSWKAIKRNLEGTGVELLYTFFQQNAEMKQLFASFRNLEVDDALRENEALEAHGTLVMTVIDEVISNIGDVDKAVDMLTRVHNQHLSFIGFSPEFFWRMEGPFIAALKVILEDRYTPQMDDIYRATIKFVLRHLSGCEPPDGALTAAEGSTTATAAPS